jgi:hypothetical protein
MEVAVLRSDPHGRCKSCLSRNAGTGDLCSVSPSRLIRLVTDGKSVLEKKLKYRISHPMSDARSWREKISPHRILHNLGWMSAMVSTAEAKQVFGRAFSRPPRLLFTNPVCFLFSAYYSYIYGMSLPSLMEAD